MRFENTMNVRLITMKLRNLKIFCHIGKSWYTLNADVEFRPNKIIPDYIEVQNFLNEHIVNKELTIEVATANILDYLTTEYNPIDVTVKSNVNDAIHFEVEVLCY